MLSLWTDKSFLDLKNGVPVPRPYLLLKMTFESFKRNNAVTRINALMP